MRASAAKKPRKFTECFFAKRKRVCYRQPRSRERQMFPGSSVVEQPAVNRLVAGSNPARGAKFFKDLDVSWQLEMRPASAFGQQSGQQTIPLDLTWMRISGCASVIAGDPQRLTRRRVETARVGSRTSAVRAECILRTWRSSASDQAGRRHRDRGHDRGHVRSYAGPYVTAGRFRRRATFDHGDALPSVHIAFDRPDWQMGAPSGLPAASRPHQ